MKQGFIPFCVRRGREHINGFFEKLKSVLPGAKKYANLKKTHLASLLYGKHFVVVLAFGIRSEEKSNFYKFIKADIQSRVQKQGDRVTFIEVHPYGFKHDRKPSEQILDVGWDAYAGGSDGGTAVLSALQSHNTLPEDKLVMIGHSGGGVAVIDAYNAMEPHMQKQVTQLVAIGAPKMDKNKNPEITTYIYDNDDPVTKIGTFKAKRPHYIVRVNNKTPMPALNSVNARDFFKVPYHAAKARIEDVNKMISYGISVHKGYFNTPKKSSHLVFQFYDRAFESQK